MTNPTQLATSIKIGGVDVTAFCNYATDPPWYESVLTNQVDSCEIVLFGAAGVDLTELQDVELWNGVELLHAGPLMRVVNGPGPSGAANKYTLTVGDYSQDIDRIEVKKRYEGYTDAAIIADMVIESGYTGYDAATYVHALKTHPVFVVNGQTLAEVLVKLCELSGGDWYVLGDKTIHYFGVEEGSSPFNISDVIGETGCEPCQELEVIKDATDIVNKVNLIGGTYLSQDKDEDVAGVGVSTSIQLPYRMIAPTTASQIVVRRNDGGAVTNLMVNPSFEVNVSDGWTQYQAGAGGAWAQDAAKYYKGTKSLKITTGTGITAARGATIAVAPGEYLTVQVRSWCNIEAMASLSIYDVSNSAKLIEQFNRKTSTWEQLTATWWNNSAVSVNVRMDVINNGTDSAQVVYFDAAQAEKHSWASDYCDGSLGTGYAWSGTANNSTSTRVDMPIWTTLTVRTGDNQELSSRSECSYFDLDGRLAQEANWPKLDKAVTVFGRRSVGLQALGDSVASFNFYGKWRWKTITDSSIVDLGVAKDRIKAELAASAFKKVAIKFKVLEPGLRSGQTLHIKNALKQLDGYYLIQRVKYTVGVGGFVVGEVEAGVYDRNLVDILLGIKRAQTNLVWRDDVVLLIIMDTNEELSMSESVEAVVASTGPYKWDDGTKWGFGSWREWRQKTSETLSLVSESTSVTASSGPYKFGEFNFGFGVFNA